MPDTVPDSSAFIAVARQQIVSARIKLADETLTPQEERELWRVVDCIESIIKMRVRCFEAELEQIDRELEERLRRPRYNLEG